MSNTDRAIETLVALGLTINQAKLYLTLTQSEEATIQALAKATKIPRESIYRSMPTLENKSLVKRILTAPERYCAVPLKDGVTMLLEIRRKENNDLWKATEELIKTAQENKQNLPLKEAEFTVLSGQEAFSREANRGTRRSQKSFDGVTFQAHFRGGMLRGIEDFRAAMQRGVKFRHVVDNTPIATIVELGAREFLNNPLWEVRYVSAILPTNMMILDRKEVLLALTSQHESKCCYLHTSSPCLVAMADSYFETLWGNARPRDEKKRENGKTKQSMVTA